MTELDVVVPIFCAGAIFGLGMTETTALGKAAFMAMSALILLASWYRQRAAAAPQERP